MSYSCVHTEPKTSGHCSWKCDGEKILGDFKNYMDDLFVLVLCRNHFCLTFVLVAWGKILKSWTKLPTHVTWGLVFHVMEPGEIFRVFSRCLCRSVHFGLQVLSRGSVYPKRINSLPLLLPLPHRSLVFIYDWITLGVIFQFLATTASKLC